MDRRRISFPCKPEKKTGGSRFFLRKRCGLPAWGRQDPPRGPSAAVGEAGDLAAAQVERFSQRERRQWSRSGRWRSVVYYHGRGLALPFGTIAEAIAARDVDVLKSLPEIGKTTATRLVTELQGRLAGVVDMPEAAAPVTTLNDAQLVVGPFAMCRGRLAVVAVFQAQVQDRDSQLFRRQQLRHEHIDTVD